MKNELTHSELYNILNNKIEFNLFQTQFDFFIQEKGGGWNIQTGSDLIDIEDGQLKLMKGGKVYISPHSTESEIVFKAWQLVQSFIEHEARECFRYEGTLIFNPHLDVKNLKEFVDNYELESRSAAIPMMEVEE